MTDLILIIAALISIVAFIEIVRRRETSSDTSTPLVSTQSSPTTKSESLSTVLQRHANDDCESVYLTTGAPSAQGRQELLSIQPGAPVWLEHSNHASLDRVKVYSGGHLIGSILLSDAEKAIRIMKEEQITGTYVAQNGCTPDGKVMLRIVIFHEATAVESETYTPAHLLAGAMTTPYKITVNLSDSTHLFQN